MAWYHVIPWGPSMGFKSQHCLLPRGSVGEASACSLGDLGSVPESGISPGEGNGYPLQYSYLENPHGWVSLVGYSPWGHKELDMTEWLTHCLLPALWPWAGCLTSLCLTLLFGKWANNCTQIISLRINGERLDLKINKRLKKKEHNQTQVCVAPVIKFWNSQPYDLLYMLCVSSLCLLFSPAYTG